MVIHVSSLDYWCGEGRLAGHLYIINRVSVTALSSNINFFHPSISVCIPVFQLILDHCHSSPFLPSLFSVSVWTFTDHKPGNDSKKSHRLSVEHLVNSIYAWEMSS